MAKGERALSTGEEARRAAFSRRLSDELDRRGWSQTDLVQRARAHVRDGGTELRNYDVSNYVRGRSLPRRDKLLVIADTLGADPDGLLPPKERPARGAPEPPFQVTLEPDGRMRLRVDMVLDPELAARVVAALGKPGA